MSCFSTETEICKHCKLSDFQEGYGPRTLLICDGCESVGSHVECEERDTAKKISEEMLAAGHNWYCSKVQGRESMHDEQDFYANPVGDISRYACCRPGM